MNRGNKNGLLEVVQSYKNQQADVFTGSEFKWKETERNLFKMDAVNKIYVITFSVVKLCFCANITGSAGLTNISSFLLSLSMYLADGRPIRL